MALVCTSFMPSISTMGTCWNMRSPAAEHTRGQVIHCDHAHHQINNLPYASFILLYTWVMTLQIPSPLSRLSYCSRVSRKVSSNCWYRQISGNIPQGYWPNHTLICQHIVLYLHSCNCQKPADWFHFPSPIKIMQDNFFSHCCVFSKSPKQTTKYSVTRVAIVANCI